MPVFNPATPIVAILRGIRPDEIVAVAETIVEAGIDVIEVPLNSPNAVESIRLLAEKFPNIISGAGTVTDPAMLPGLEDAGAQIIVAPNMNEDVIRGALARGMIPMPGVQTITEAFAAVAAGATHLKLFPAGVVGPSFVKAARAVLPAHVKLYAVGGAGAHNLGDWLAAGVNGFGIGTEIYRPGMTVAEVRAQADAIVAAYKAAQE
ncbi:MAG: 2-dehydro-3-deoxy-6-phosphogalactonate aldolase [Alphaproteobacteria bacterium]|nr:2-dehydro-3-deoxy-6-phosphogalactonate aldolase [Alphaproteobacteria bacterium]